MKYLIMVEPNSKNDYLKLQILFNIYKIILIADILLDEHDKTIFC